MLTLFLTTPGTNEWRLLITVVLITILFWCASEVKHVQIKTTKNFIKMYGVSYYTPSGVTRIVVICGQLLKLLRHLQFVLAILRCASIHWTLRTNFMSYHTNIPRHWILVRNLECVWFVTFRSLLRHLLFSKQVVRCKYEIMYRKNK